MFSGLEYTQLLLNLVTTKLKVILKYFRHTSIKSLLLSQLFEIFDKSDFVI